MSSLPITPSLQAFRAKRADLQANLKVAGVALLKAHGVSPADFTRIDASGLSFLQVLTFIETYGQLGIGVILDVAAAVGTISTNPASAIATLTALYAKDGASIIQLANAIGALFGITIPVIPT